MELLNRRLPTGAEVAQGPQRPYPGIRRYPALPENNRRPDGNGSADERGGSCRGGVIGWFTFSTGWLEKW